jgi:predicted secreted acid phosphatase
MYFKVINMKTVVVDVDGTLADNTHRQGYLRNKPKNWKAYNENMPSDGVHEDIVDLVRSYYKLGYKIIIVTAREGSDRIRAVTMDWLSTKANVLVYTEKVMFRQDKDFRDDSIVKKEILDQLRLEGYDVKIAIDDRNKVCQMWRENGIRCLQVADGNF